MSHVVEYNISDILNQISIPIYIALGNHDKRSSFNKVFKKIKTEKMHVGHWRYH